MSQRSGGLNEVIALPARSTATQRPLLGHDTPDRVLVPSTLATVQDAARVGSVEVITLPLLSTATHRLLLGHETPNRILVPSTLVTVQAAEPPVGLVEVATLPASSTATHRLLKEQDTAFREEPPKDGWWLTRTAAAHTSGPEGMGVDVGVGVGVGVTAIEVADGVGESAAVLVGVALGWNEDCALVPEEPPHAARIRTSPRTAALMQALTPTRSVSYDHGHNRNHRFMLVLPRRQQISDGTVARQW
jgi:hypothetical protein